LLPFTCRAGEWRASLTIGNRMEWQWCKTEEEAAQWVRDHIPKGTKSK
jgi:hypothetical protein